MKRQPGRRTFAVALCGILTLSACTNPDVDSSEGDADTSRLRVALATFGAESFDPIDMSTATAFDVLTPMYDSLLGVDMAGEIAPGVAESWEVNADSTQVTFKLRQGMKFHNGEDLTADDVKYSLLRWLDPELEASVVPPFASLLNDPERDIEIVDDFNLRVSTPKGPAERFVSTVSTQQQHEAYVLPKDYLEEKGTDFFRDNPVGSGPWKFKSQTKGDSMLFERAEAHPWRPAPAFTELELALVPEEATRLAQLKAGEVDIVPISPESVSGIDEACCEVAESKEAIQVHMFYNGSWTDEAGPVADVRVREALSLAIDRQEIVDQIMQGYGSPIPGSLPGEFFPGMSGLEISDFPGEVYDPDRAKQLLTEAGFPNGFEIRVHAFEMSGAPYLASLAQIFLGYWERIGVRGQVMPTDLDTFFDMADVPNIDDRTIGTVNPFRRRRGYEGAQAVNGYTPTETPGGSLIGPPGQTIIPDVEKRISDALAATGDQREALTATFLKEVGGLYLAPGLFYASALWGVGNRAGDWQVADGSAQLGLTFETVKPRGG